VTNHFTTQSATYAAFRPTYPAGLFDWIAGIAPARETVWDCATGTGQAAVDLATVFTRVIATDGAENQIAHATPHERVTYRVAPADASGLAAGSVDAVTVAQAIHWFDLDAFYAEARRVLVPDGVLVVWGYGNPVMPTDALEAIVSRYNNETLAPWWPAERQIIVDEYRSMPFPFERFTPPPFALTAMWTLPHLAGYLRSWSGTVRYAASLGAGADPVAPVEAALREVWGDPETVREIRWPIAIRAGR